MCTPLDRNETETEELYDNSVRCKNNDSDDYFNIIFTSLDFYMTTT